MVDTTRSHARHSDDDTDHLLDSDPRISAVQDYELLDTPTQTDGPLNEELYLICRGHVPAYLITSRVQAIGIIVSRLQPPSWKPSIGIPSALCTAPGIDMGLWCTLIRDFLTEGGGSDAKHQRRRVRGSGLVLLLQGPKRTTHAIPRCKWHHTSELNYT